ncbi:MAG: hypothetical protein HC842_05645, partial [Cytophagales bacterium]|nr:hypothetical protein [Cytophagales bacterium]
VRQARLRLTRQIDGTTKEFSVFTDSLGFYRFDTLYYAEETLFRMTPSLDGHSFINQQKKTSSDVKLDRFTPSRPSENFHSLKLYDFETSNQFRLAGLQQSVEGRDTLHYFRLEWGAQVSQALNQTQDVYFNVYRNNSLLSTFAKRPYVLGEGRTIDSVQTFVDYSANPDSSYRYRIVMFQYLDKSKMLIDSVATDLSFGPLANVITNFEASAQPQRAEVLLTWNNPQAWNCDGYLIHRSRAAQSAWETVDTLYQPFVTSYVDQSGKPGQAYTYYLRPFVNNNGIDYKPSDTASEASATYPSLPIPSLAASVESTHGKVALDLSLSLPVAKEEFGFSGLVVFKEGVAIDTVRKVALLSSGASHTIRVYDDQGVPGTYDYAAAAFKQVGDSSYLAALSTHAELAYAGQTPPVLHTPVKDDLNVVKLNWTMHPNSVADSVLLTRRPTGMFQSETSLAVLPAGTWEYTDIIASSNKSAFIYQLKPFKHLNGTRHFHNPSNTQHVSDVSYPSGPQRAVDKLVASRIYDRYVELSWEYPTYIHNRFEVSRDGQVIAILDKDYRSFKDTEVDLGSEHVYKVRAINPQGIVSAYRTALGRKRSVYGLYGRALSADYSQSIAAVELRIVAHTDADTLGYWVVRTDSSGYYRLSNLPQLENATWTVSGQKTNHRFDTVQTQLAGLPYEREINLYDQVPHPSKELREMRVSEIVSLSAMVNEEKNHVALKWIPEGQPTGGNFDGFYVYRDYEAILHFPSLSFDFSAIDSTGQPGRNYIYSVQAYWNGPKGQQKSRLRDIRGTVLYPGYSTITALSAVKKLDSNQVELYWSHYGAADHFEIYRSEELLAQWPVESQYRFVDSTGIPGHSYKYAVKSYHRASDTYSEPRWVNVDYPSLVPVHQFSAETDELGNRVQLQWSYAGKSIDGFMIERNGDRMAILDDRTFAWQDTMGIPETWHQYEITAFRQDTSDYYSSTAVMDTAYFPELVAVSALTTSSANHLITLNWDYAYGNVDGFHLYRVDRVTGDSIPLATLGARARQFEDAFGLPGRLYTYGIVVADTRGKEEVEYRSDPTSVQLNYPRYKGFDSQSSVATSSYIEVKWSYSWPYIDGFVVRRNNLPVDTLPSWANAYIDHLPNACTAPGNQTYEIRPFRTIEGVLTTDGTVEVEQTRRLSTCTTTSPLANFRATQGTQRDKVKLQWEYTDESGIENVRIHKYLGTALLDTWQLTTSYSFFEDDQVLEGVEYRYEISAKKSGLYGLALSAVGYSQNKGSLIGSVRSYHNSSAVPNIEARLRASHQGKNYNYLVLSDAQGQISFNNLYVGTGPGDTVWYDLSVSYENHQFINGEQRIGLSQAIFSRSLEIIYDLNATIFYGHVLSTTGCGQDSVKVQLFYMDQNMNPSPGEYDYTDASGAYQILPSDKPNLLFYSLVADGQHPSLNTERAYWAFAADSITLEAKAVKSLSTKINFTDTTNYPVQVEVKNGCGWSVG